MNLFLEKAPSIIYGMRKRLFVIFATVLSLLSLAFMAYAFYLLHQVVWENAIFIFLFFFMIFFSLFFLVGALLFFNFAGPIRRVRIIFNILLPALLFGGLLTDAIFEHVYFSSYVSFSPEKWQSIEKEYKTYMAESFLDQYEVKEMEISEVISLLGEPMKEGDIVEPNEDYSYYFRYDCGIPKGGFAMDPYYLDFYTLGPDRSLVVIDYNLQEA